MGQLQGKTAIITGSGTGLGEAIARRYASEGARVIVADIDQAGAARVAADIGAAALAVHADVTRRTDVENLVQQCQAAFGAVDIVVNNAGVVQRNQPLWAVDEATFDRIFAVNVKAIYYMTCAVVPLMRAQKHGVILNLGSTGGIRPRSGLAWYNASKGAVNLLSKSMAVELAPDGIRVNAICPSLAVTNMFEPVLNAPDTPENRARFLSTIPLGRFCEPGDIAAAAVFLASEASSFMTGVVFPVDGGRTA